MNLMTETQLRQLRANGRTARSAAVHDLLDALDFVDMTYADLEASRHKGYLYELPGIVTRALTDWRNEARFYAIKPAVRLHTIDRSAVWLLSAIDPEDPHLAYGVWDIDGNIRQGSIHLSAIEETLDSKGMLPQQDHSWEPDRTVADYAEEARRVGRLVL